MADDPNPSPANPNPTPPPPAENQLPDHWDDITRAILLVILTIIMAGSSILLINQTKAIREAFSVPEVVLPFLVLVSITALVVLLALVSAVFKQLDLTDPKYALGLPQGTVRALIALSLIFIFASTSLWLFRELGNESSRTSILPESQYNQLLAQPDFAARIVEVDLVPDNERPNTSSTEPLYRIRLEDQPNEASEDFAKQVLTTISTLVVAVAGFYFGSRAVESGQRSANAADDDQ